LDKKEVEVLLRLLYMEPSTKNRAAGQLAPSVIRVLVALCSCSKTRAEVLRSLLAMISGGQKQPVEAMATCTSAASSTTTTTADLRQSPFFSPVETPDHSLLGYRPEGAIRVLPPSGAGAPPPLVCRRVLDGLVSLARNNTHVVDEMLAAENGFILSLLMLAGNKAFCSSAENLERVVQLLGQLTRMLVSPEEADRLEREEQAKAEQEQKKAEEAAKEQEEKKVATEKPKVLEAKKARTSIVCPVIPQEGITSLCSLLSAEACSEGTFKGTVEVASKLAQHPANRAALVTQLVATAQGLRDSCAELLRDLVSRLGAHDLSKIASEAAATTVLSALGLSNTSSLLLQRVVEALGAVTGGSQPQPEPPTAAAAAAAGRRDQRQQSAAIQIPSEVLSQLRLEVLWEALDMCMAAIFAIRQAVTTAGDVAAPVAPKPRAGRPAAPPAVMQGSSITSPALTLLLPIIQLFFIANAPTSTGPPLKAVAQRSPQMTASQPPSDLLRTSSMSLSIGGLTTSSSSSSSSTTTSSGPELTEADSSRAVMFMQFADRHKILLNDLIRENNALLIGGPLQAMLRTPRLLDFDNKRNWFRTQLQRLRERDRGERFGGLRITVRRDTVFEDSFHAFESHRPEELRGKLTVRFNGEEGIDAGGVTREWYQVISRELFNPDYALFKSSDEGAFQPNPSSWVNPEHYRYFKFVGRVVGKALWDGQLLDAHFTRSFYKHILGSDVTLRDMEALDNQYFRNLKLLLENPVTADMGLYFIIDGDEFGKMRTFELKSGGRDIAVTEENKLEFVRLSIQFRLSVSIQKQIMEFLAGFRELIPAELVAPFNENELELLISGLPEIDVEDLRANTEYHGYDTDSPQIAWFWRVVNEMTQEEKAELLQFVTGTGKVPLDGFGSLHGIGGGVSRFSIHRSPRTDSLPTAHTCFNQLDLPCYDSYEKLRSQLLLAIKEGCEGFGFG
jgi:E3 ubiquitin-protein ligase HUWE1